MRRPLLGRRAVRAASALAVAAAGVGVFLVGWGRYRASAGEPSERLADGWHRGHQVVDRNGEVLVELPSPQGNRGRSVPIGELGDRVVLATLVSEDRAFYEHDGVDGAAIARAVAQNVRHARLVSGASTITQQLVKLLDTGGAPHPKSLAEKLLEAARAQNLEERLGKERILEEYLARLSYGHGLVGPEAAARGYFGVAARDLSWAQAAFLAVLPRAPSYLDPYQHGDRVLLRQRALLAAMRAAAVLSEPDLARARSEVVAPRPLERPFFAPHFVASLRADGALSAGPVTHTTLELELQRDVEGLVRTHLAAFADRRVTAAAVVVVDNERGDVLAYVGSPDFRGADAGQVDLARARRQPGSALKPFVYAMAFERGATPSDPLADVPVSFAEGGRGSYAPTNFDGGWEGPISAREALAGSLNVPAVRLAAQIGAGPLLDRLHDLGLASLDQDASHYGLALALGSGEITLRELAGAYVTLARGGERVALRTVTDPAETPGPAPGRIFDEAAAALVLDSLSDPLARVRGLHGQGPFDLGYPVAVKTGTSSGFRDAWTAGVTHERTVAVWVGNADGSPMRAVTGASGAGPLFSDVMARAMRDVPRRAPLFDESLLEVATVCPLSGKLPGPDCADHASRRFARGHAPAARCDMHVHGRRAAAGGVPVWSCGAGSERAMLLPGGYDGWLGTQPPGAPGQDPQGVSWWPRSAAVGCDAAGTGAPTLVVEAPADGAVFALDRGESADRQRIEVVVAVREGSSGVAGPVELVLDGRAVARTDGRLRASIPVTPGDHDLVARPADPTVAFRVAQVRFSVR